jgi:preprotein translocase subunit SecF
MQIFTNANFNFIRWRWHALVLSAVVIAAGFVSMATRGLPLGIDFSGGTLLVAEFEQPTSVAQVRDAIADLPGDEVVQQFDVPSLNQISIRLARVESTDEADSLSLGSEQVSKALEAAGLPAFEIVKRELVSATIGEDLQQRGIYATLASILAIAVYIGFRFRPSFAIGAITATFHDILVTLAFLTFAGYDLSLNVVAALLAITGYSVNDTIVVFDRVRENLKAMRREPLEKVVNLSVNQTLSRTIITAGTTFLAVLGLYVFGGEALQGFAFTMLVGIAAGTYSTVFIASAIAIILSGRSKTAGASPAAAARGEAPARQGRKQRGARAS